MFATNTFLYAKVFSAKILSLPAQAFQKINALPVSSPNEILKIDVLVKNMAKWHKL